jgi:hypothetical protein
MNVMNESGAHMRADPAPVERLAVFLNDRNVGLTPVRCPNCQKLLANCAVRGMVEILCPRCKTLVRNTFA